MYLEFVLKIILGNFMIVKIYWVDSYINEVISSNFVVINMLINILCGLYK